MRVLFTLLITLSLASCMDNDNYVPKRKGYFRIALPEKQYVTYRAGCPFTFEYPTYAQVLKDTDPSAEPCWLNVYFPGFKGTINLTYKVVDNDLSQLIAQSQKFVANHEVKASAINEKDISNPKEQIYGTVYEIEGNAASNVQFYITDSSKNFIRGALYFYSVPNKDSIEPVLKFVKEDVYHMVESFRWKSDSVK